MPNAAHDPWTAVLIGHQWPADAALHALDAGARNRHGVATAFDSYAQSLQSNSRNHLAAQEGLTAHHTREAFASGERHARMIAEKNIARKGALQQAHSTTRELRSQLSEIAERSHGRIRTILDSRIPQTEKFAHLVDLVTAARCEANVRAAACTQAMFGSIQSVLNESRSGMTARQFAAMHGVVPEINSTPTCSEAIRRDVAAALKKVGDHPNVPEPTRSPAGPGGPGRARPWASYGHGIHETTTVTALKSHSARTGPIPVGGTALLTAAGRDREIAESVSASDRRLRRILEFVARQEPLLRWGVGDHTDGKTYLATDLAGGWIPPTVVVPLGLGLPSPAGHGGDLQSLIGRATRSMVHEPGHPLPAVVEQFAAQRVSSTARVDGLELRLVQAIRSRAGLPPLASTLARALCARTGFGGHEARGVTDYLRFIGRKVVHSYPAAVDTADVGNWQLMASVDALLRDEPLQAAYHFEWFRA